MPTQRQIESLLRSTQSLRDQVAGHPVFSSLQTIEQVRLFMEHHVFAVWDFMALVKSLQNVLTCTSVPWLPQGDPVARRLINEIVLDEESDDGGDGTYVSHFELYLGAMKECGADTSRIGDFVERIRRGEEVLDSLRACEAPEAARAFVDSTWEILSTVSPHRIASAFAIGREEIIPEMFRAVIENLRREHSDRLDRFVRYLERHVDIDKERHWPMAVRMLESLCGDNEFKWREAAESAQAALRARLALWDAVAQLTAEMPMTNPAP